MLDPHFHTPGWAERRLKELRQERELPANTLRNADGTAYSARSEALAEQLARLFHETYERLAPEHGYETRKESAKPWSEVPEKNKRLMVAVAGEVLRQIEQAGGIDYISE